MVFDYAVKYNGKYYPPDTPIVESNFVKDDANDKVAQANDEIAKKPKKGRAKKDAV